MKRSNLTRKELAKAINEKLGFSQRSSGELVDKVFECLKRSLLAGESVKLVQFGTFNVRRKEPRKGRNPRTGDAMTICRRRMVSFRPSKLVRDKINNT